ncbi:PaaI family thioesterase [Amycolatopsis cihanbeyliensis]|uniref:Uncharacterized protein (TIGR00369 family) n=1 Tax=Amycolatopsis cihanbeyliensis TaxID=1128664 RepID=A0A542CUU2_AMYCI|nr:PaaI family thioesterase [Amycolatopsis cihanbeyliensis]TQI94581.1 uncharacterized protein (TIGR00369 family) [Amycolatopsis cihanbeyliensis]
MPDTTSQPPDAFLVALLDQGTELDGLGMLTGVAEGRIPHPDSYRRIGLRVTGAEPGTVRLDWTPTAAARNFAGGVDGGCIATVFDQACCNTAASRCEHCVPMVTLSLSVDYFAPLAVGEHYRVLGDLVHPGRRRMVAHARILDTTGTVLAHATAAVVPDSSFPDRIH